MVRIFRKKKERVKLFEGGLEEIKSGAAELAIDMIRKVDEIIKFVRSIKGIAVRDSKIVVTKTEKEDVEIELHFILLIKKK